MVWIGDAVSKASKLSGYGDKNCIPRIVMNGLFHSNLASFCKDNHPDEDIDKWFYKASGLPYDAWCGNVIITGMNDWVNSGMPE